MTQTISKLTIDETQGQTKELLSGAKAALGMVPNLFGVLANAPAALAGYMSLNDSLLKGVLTAKQREQIALAVAEENRCSYCLSAHSVLGKGAGLKDDEIMASRKGESADTTTSAILSLAKKLVETRGQVGARDLATAREAGLTDAQILETVSHVALNILTNYTNNLAGTEIDFPIVEPAKVNA